MGRPALGTPAREATQRQTQGQMNGRTERIVLYTLGAAAVLALMKKGKLIEKATEALNYKGQFKAKLIGKALDIQKRLGIDPNLLIAQSALESNWGRSELTTKDNNYFGMTAGSWLAKGLPVSDWPTTEYVNKPADQIIYFDVPGDIIAKEAVSPTQTKLRVHRYFRHYDTMEASLDDWANLISSYSGYKSAYAAAQKGDLTAFAKSMQEAGYATDPQYAQKVLDVGSQVIALA